jgi:hypothetical protein
MLDLIPDTEPPEHRGQSAMGRAQALIYTALTVALLPSICVLGVEKADKGQQETDQEVKTVVDFEAGQIWEYATRPGEASSRLTVLKVESAEKLGEIVHIRLDGVAIKGPKGETVTTISHLPYSELALRKSVTRLAREKVQVPDFAEGYKSWKDAKGGVFTIPVSECVEIMVCTHGPGDRG